MLRRPTDRFLRLWNAALQFSITEEILIKNRCQEILLKRAIIEYSIHVFDKYT